MSPGWDLVRSGEPALHADKAKKLRFLARSWIRTEILVIWVWF